MKNSILHTFYFLSAILFFSCQNTTEIATEQQQAPLVEEKKIESKEKSSIEIKGEELFKEHFTSEEQALILKIKVAYEGGIVDGFTFDNIGEAYTYNSTVLRGDLFNEIPHTLTFPYNGKFTLSTFEKELPKLSFITKKCGFQDAKTKEVVNFYCPNLNENFFNYLDKVGKNNNLIQKFREEYLSTKTITDSIKQSMILNSTADLDFNNINHQIFYMLFHIFVNEEQKALEKVK